MEFKVVTTAQYQVGTPTLIESFLPNQSHLTIFEDNGETAYLYAVHLIDKQITILDTLHIFNVQNVTDKHLTSEIQILWSNDPLIAILQINEYPHAIFDFHEKLGYCRTNFPPSAKRQWSPAGHQWNQQHYNSLISD